MKGLVLIVSEGGCVLNALMILTYAFFPLPPLPVFCFCLISEGRNAGSGLLLRLGIIVSSKRKRASILIHPWFDALTFPHPFLPAWGKGLIVQHMAVLCSVLVFCMTTA